jgi:DNA recombination-dependent growth factor C
MGLQSSSISITRFRLLGYKKSRTLAHLNELFASHQSRPLKLQGAAKEDIVGWVRPPIADIAGMTERDEWSLSDCRLDNGFYLRLRSERRRVSSSLLQSVFRDALARREAKRSNPLNRQERKELSAETKRELLQMTLPSLSYVDGFWRPDSGQLLIFSASTASADNFANLFRETFCSPLGMNMIAVSLPLMGLVEDLWSEESKRSTDWIQRISLTIPTSFVEHSAL